MTKDLTSSTVNRQNILNNHYALEQIESNLSLGGTYLHDGELVKNGYRVLKSKELKDFKEYVSDIDVGDILKTQLLTGEGILISMEKVK